MAKLLFMVYFLFFVVLVFVGFFVNKAFLLSSQAAFFSSLLILFASFKSYKMRVENKLKDEEFIKSIQENNEDDDIDENLDDASLKSEKARLKKQGALANLKNINLRDALFPYRLLAYGVLFVGFLTLQRSGNLSIVGLLVGLVVMPLGALAFGVTQKYKEKNG